MVKVGDGMQLLCFGDSLTNGYDVPRGLGWVELVQKEFPDVEIQNHGIDGDTLQGILYRLERVSSCTGSANSKVPCSDGVAVRRAENKRYIFLMGGSNDILMGRDETYCFKKMIELIAYARSKGATLIVGLAPQINFDMAGLDLIMVRYIELLKQYCAEQHIDTIDFYRVIHDADMQGKLVFAGDVHPNEPGYALMAEKAKKVLARLL